MRSQFNLKISLATIAIFMTSSAFSSENCSTIDFGRPQEGLWSQASSEQAFGLCYAFSAAEVISQKLGQNVSAIDISISYNKHLDVFSKAFRKVTG